MSQKQSPLHPNPTGNLEAERGGGRPKGKIKFEGYGEEMIQKVVKQSGSSGRVYLPPEWVGKNVRIIRID